MAVARTLVVALALLLIPAGSAAAAPVLSYRVTPNPPEVGVPTTFTSTSTRDPSTPITGVAWDFDANPDFEAPGTSVQRTFTTPGTRQARLQVTDANGATVLPFSFYVNAAPVGQFGFSPVAPVAGQEVLFQSFSYDIDGSVVTHEWDFDNDPNPDFNDGDANETNTLGSFTFATPGDKTVRLRVRDTLGTSRIVRRTVSVAPAPPNQLPVAQFAIAPLVPYVGEQVSLKSFSYDRDGSVVSQRWDLDGDGDFDENVTGKTAFTVFTKPGTRALRLEVRDSVGGVHRDTQSIAVKAEARPVVSSSGQQLMYPFPVVRLAGSVIGGGARVRMLEVRAPARSKITVQCFGQSCPAKRFAKASAPRRVRFKQMARFLRAGTVIKVAVRKGKLIGKHTRWLIRDAKLPQRKDLCLYPGKSKPKRCPRS
jgi:PKD repeat protein